MKPVVEEKQSKMKVIHDNHSKDRELHCGDPVYALNFGRGDKWVPGVIVSKLGTKFFSVLLQDGRFWTRHINHLLSQV